MSSTRNLQSSVSMKDGSGPSDVSKPKPPRASVCARITEESASMRKKVSQKSKQSEILPTRGKFTAKKTEPVEGSSPKKFVKNTEHSQAEQVLYNNGNQASNDAASMRQQSKAKAQSCETDGVLFDKKKRQSFMTESMRSGKVDKKRNENAHEEADHARKASSDKNHSSSIFAQSIENRPLKAINIKQEAELAAPSKKSDAEAKLVSEGRIASDDAENARKQLQARQGRSSVFSSSSEQRETDMPRGGKMCSRPTSASSIFGGGAWAEDAKKLPAPKASAAPKISSDCGDNSMARSRRDAALRGSGGLW